MSMIDTTSSIQVQRANDYVYDVELIRRLQRQVKTDGEVTVIKNGAQEYRKEHPALNQIDKVSKRIRSFESEFMSKGPPKESVTKKVSLT